MIYLKDGLLFLKSLDDGSVDLILTDPPYEINYYDNISKTPLKKIKNDTSDSIDWQLFFTETYRVLKPHKTLYMNCRTDMLLNISSFIKNSEFKYCHDFVWLKGDMGYGNLNIMGTTHEMILALSKKNPEKNRQVLIDGKIKKRTAANYRGKVKGQEYYGHPTQKPVGLLTYIILARTNENDLILDPFCGVGSTAVAAHITNRQFMGTELDKHFYELAIKRLKDEKHLKQYFDMLLNGLTYESGAISFNNEAKQLDIKNIDNTQFFIY